MTSTRMCRVFGISFFLFSCFLVGPAMAITVQGTLFTNTQWTQAMSPVILTGDVTVNTGVTLTIDPGVVVQAASSDGQSAGSDTTRVELIVSGTLRAIGNSSGLITFKGSSNTKGSWYGIRVMSGASITLSYAKVEYARRGIENAGTTDLSEVEVSNCSDYGIYVTSGNNTVSRTKMHSNNYGLYVAGGINKISESEIYRNTGYGVYASYSSTTTTLDLDYCTIAYNSSYGVYINRSSSSSGVAKLTNSIVVRNYPSSTSGYEVYSPNYGITCSDNLIWDTNANTIYNTYSPSCTASVVYNPLFVDEANDDYRIYDRSPARKAGANGTDIGALDWNTGQRITGVLHGRIYQDLTLPAGQHNIPGDLIVAAGVTLTLSPGANLLFASSDDMYGGLNVSRAELVVEGKLVALGSSSQKIALRATSTSTSASLWYGIVVAAGGNAELKYVEIKNGQYGVDNAGTTTLADSDISYNQYGLYIRSGNVTGTSSKIFQNTSYGVYQTNGVVKLTYTQIYRNASYGVYASYSGTTTTLDLDYCTIAYNGSYGVYINRSSSSSGVAKLTNSIVVRNYPSSTSGYEVYSPNYGITCSDNLIWDTNANTIYNTYSPSCTASMVYNPLFVDEANDDYRIYDRSPARMIGSNNTDAGALSWSSGQRVTNVLHGKLFQDLTLGQGNHSLVGDLMVAPGVTLTLEQGAVLEAKPSDDMYGGSNVSQIEIVVEGKLYAVGGTSPSTQVQMQAEGTTTSTNRWYGVRVVSGGSLDMRYTVVRSGSYCISNQGTATISDVELTYCGSYGLYILDGNTTFVRGKLHRNGYGIYISGGVSRLSYLQIYRNTSYGVYGSYSSTTASVWMDHCTIAYNSSYGVYVNRSSSSSGKFELNNSIIVRNGGTSTSGYEIYSPNYGVTCNNNLAWDSVGSSFIYNTYSPSCVALVQGNPLFVNEAQDDYHLQSTSPARQKATDNSDLGALPFSPTLAQIIVSPGVLTIEVTKSLTVFAQGIDSGGNPVTGLSFTWTVVAGGGTINSSGVFTAGTKTGTYNSTIEATANGIKGYATVVITPGPVAKVTILPNPGTVKAGDSLTFTATALDAHNNNIAGQTAQWTVSPTAGTIDSAGTLKATTNAGTYANAITATIGAISGQATVQVTNNTLTKITVSPNPGNVDPNKTLQFTASGEDAYSNNVPNLQVTWKIVNGGGTIDPTGLLTANATIATFTNTVSASSGNVTGYATLIVGGGVPKVATVEITPNTASLKFGDTLSFTARAKDNGGQIISGKTFTWSLPTGGGTFTTSSGLQTRADFVAGNKAGNYTIVADTDSIKGSASIVIKDPNAGVLDKIVVSPATATVKVNQTQQFSAQGYDKLGNTVVIAPLWSVSGCGTIDTKGLFTAGTTANTCTVTAKDGNISGTAQVQVTAGKAPSTPTLQSPTDKSETATNQPTLTVTNSTDPDGDKLQYEFEIASDAQFASVIVGASVPEGTNTTSWQVSKQLQEDTTYYWRARAFDGALRSAWSPVWSFRVNAVNSPPTAPKLSSPVDAGQVALTQPNLEVTNATDPEGQPLEYVFEVATDKTMTTVVVRSSRIKEGTSGTTSWKVTSVLKDGTTYYWQAWAIDNKGLEGAKMTVASFTVSLANQPPTSPMPRLPKDGDVVTTLRPALEVTNATDPDNDPITLDFEVDTVKTFDGGQKITKTGLAQNSGGITSWTVEQDLQENQNYFWRVRASDGKTATNWVFGGEFKVNSQNDPPSAPTPKSPTDQNTVTDPAVTLEVENSTDPDGDKLTYHFQISEDKTFQGQLEEQQPITPGQTTTSWQPKTSMRGKTYHWRARANDGTTYGNWSAVYSFTIELGESTTESNPTELPTESTSSEEEPASVQESTTEVQTEATTESSSDASSSETSTTPEEGTSLSENTGGTENIAKESGSQRDNADPTDQGGGGGCGCSSAIPTLPGLGFFLLLLFVFVSLRRQR